MPLEPGSKIGAYTITAPLGAGGMGEVYRATDSKLKREVAIKVLPDDLARDPDRLARFEREAHLLAALNHPNIGAIYGVEESGGAQCLVLELIEGQTLGEMIPDGGMSVEQALPIALQIAEALEAAHTRGIVHRDLKPANIKVTPDGKVKVLDFGLAKAFTGDAEGGSSDVSMSPTLTAAATQAGVIIGTAAYMSPEQAAGQAADHRADIWSFGVVLMEILSGRRLFDGETVSHTLASVLKDDPDWQSLPNALPGRVRELLRRCLLKNARKRLQSIGEARIVIEEYLADPDAFEEEVQDAGAGTQTARTAKSSLLPWAVAALLAISLPIAIWWLRAGPSPVLPLRRANILLPEGELPFRGYGSSAVISPDGSRIAFTTGGTESRSLHLRYIDQWKGKVVVSAAATSPDGPYHPFFSPDGEWIGFVTPSEMKKVSIRGGPPITLCPVERNRGADWGPDGRIVFAVSPSSGLSVVSAAGGEPSVLTELNQETDESSHRWPQWLPGGQAVLFTALTAASNFDSATLEILDVESGEHRTVQRGGTYGRYISSGHIVYINQGTLFAMPFDADTLQATGEAAPVIEGVASNREQGGAQFSISDDGILLYITGSAQATGSTLVWIDGEGERTTLWDQAQDYGNPAFSPDGTRLAIDIESEGYHDVWIYDLTRDVPTRLTFADGDDYSPVWSTDGETIYFASEREGIENIYRKPADGSGEAELVLQSDRLSVPIAISPDGRYLSYLQLESSHPDIWILPLEGGDPELFVATPRTDYGGRYSPDGRWIVYGTNESGSFQVYVRPAAGGRGRWQISTGIGMYPQWSPDGHSIYYRTATQGITAVRVETEGGAFRPGRPAELIEGSHELVLRGTGDHHYTVSPDGERFLMMQRTAEASAADRAHLHIVFNWSDELQRTFAPAGGR